MLIENHVSLIEYADDMGETLDLTVLGEDLPRNLLVHSLADADCRHLGGWWGSGKRGGKIGSLLCGLRNEQDPPEDGSLPT